MVSRARRSRHAARKERAGFRLGVVGMVIAGVLVAGCLAVVAVCAIWLQDLPDYTDASAYNVAEKTKVYASDGTTLLAELYLENRDPIELSEMGDYVTKGTIATEDERFYEHNGVDLFGIARAAWVNITGTGHEGASTITQQFVRNTILADEATESTFKRKVREAYIALQLEQMYSKDEILQMYLNTINYGQGAYGIQAAAELYFSKNAKDLTIAEAATLIGIPQSPTYNNPIDNPDNCLQRRNLVLDRMLSNGVITQEEHDAAQAEPISLNVTMSDSNDGLYQYKYFTSYVRDTLLEDYSADEVFKGGLTVITTLDVNTQKAAEQAADAKLAGLDDNLELAMVAVDPDTGFIRAMIGGRDYDTDEFNLATQAKRQPGSSFKTFTLLAALNDGVSPDTNLNCTSHVNIDGWEVENYGGSNYGTRSIASAFAVSSNTGFAELCTEIGPEKVVEMANTCGIEEDLEAYPSITLGAQEVTVREMAQAYATIANGGTKHEATCIQSITDSSGNVIFNADTTGEKVLDTALTQAATEVMEGVITNGTGRGAAISNGQPAAGKTGTSENWRDKWFCGITPQMSVAIWIGGREEVRMPSYVAADDVFGDFMSTILEGQPIEQFPTSDEELEYTTHDFGHGEGATGEAPEHEGDTVTTPDSEETDSESSDTSAGTGGSGSGTGSGGSGETPTQPGGGGSTGGGAGGSGGDTGGGGETPTQPGGGGETPTDPSTQALYVRRVAQLIQQMSYEPDMVYSGFAIRRAAQLV